MFPTLYLKNQFGEQSNNTVIGGSSQIFAKFKVAKTDSGGLGIVSLVQQGVAAVIMNTTATPASTINPIAGLIVLQLLTPANALRSFFASLTSPNSGTPINVTSGLTLNKAYTIVTLGTTTQANWQTLGLASSIVAAIGVTFVAITASAGSGTGTVEVAATAGSAVDHLEMIGDPNANAVGGQFVFQALSGGTLTAPADGTIIEIALDLIPDAASLI